MKPCFLFWKNAAKQMTPAPPATVAMTDAAMLPLLNGLPSNCAGCGGRARARGGSFTVERRWRQWRRGAWTVSDLVRVDASGSTQRSASKNEQSSAQVEGWGAPLNLRTRRDTVPPPIALLPAGAARAVTSRSAAMEDIGAAGV